MPSVTQKDYDEGGKIARKGQINHHPLQYCMDHSYISSSPPITTGRELFGKQFTESLLMKFPSIPGEDIVTSVTMFTVKSIVENYKKFILPEIKIAEVIIGGGGSYNGTLLEMIQSLLGNEIQVYTQAKLGYSCEAKEAAAFALLANETYHGNPSNVPKATGANKGVVLGNNTFPEPGHEFRCKRLIRPLSYQLLKTT